MKLLVFSYHIILSTVLPSIVIFLAFSGPLRFVVLGVYLLLWCAAYTYMDKVILFFLGGREIIDQDNQQFFQQLKSESYKNFVKTPKVYLYGGHAPKCFVLESRKEWSVVIDRSLEKEMSLEQTRALVNFIVRFKKSKVAWRLTKSHGLATLVTGLSYWFLTKFLAMNTKGKVFKVVNFFVLAIFKPYLDAVLLTGKNKLQLEADQSLEPLINVGAQLDPGLDYNQFLLANLQEQINSKDLLIRRLEKYPVMEQAVIKRSI